MRYSISHGIVQYGANIIINDINFTINDNDKVALIGRNGCGKTTLLKLIYGELETSNLDSDEQFNISFPNKQTIGMLKQTSFIDQDITIEDELKKAFKIVFETENKMHELEKEMSINQSDSLLLEYEKCQNIMDAQRGYTWKQDLEITFQKFGFKLEDLKRPISSFSGGMQTKVAFIKLLLERPDIMLLDEPTNHLDMTTINWLEEYIKSYNKSVVIVSHDREFLDNTCNITYEIEYGKITRYKGNYSKFLKQKEESYEKQLKAYIAQQKEIERLTSWIEKWKNTPSKVTQTRSKAKEIEHMVKIEKPRRFDTKSFKSFFSPRIESYTDVLTVKNLIIGYDNKEIANVNFNLKKGDKLAIIGENGIGKSTLLKTIVGKIKPISGTFYFGNNVESCYFDQQNAINILGNEYDTVLEHFQNIYPSLTIKEVRSALAAFMFTQDEVNKKISSLSGGEKVRLELCKLFYKRPNLLILDEPTNHMDIIGKETLEKMLQSFSGTVLFVSHDRYFIKSVATSILEFNKDDVKYYNCDYYTYLNKKTQTNNTEENVNTNTKENNIVDPIEKEIRVNPYKALNKLIKQKEKLEIKLEEYQQEISLINNQLQKIEVANNYEKLIELDNELTTLQENEEILLGQIIDAEERISEVSKLVDNK